MAPVLRTLVDSENLGEMNLVFLLHVAIYRQASGGDVESIRLLFAQVLNETQKLDLTCFTV